MLRNLNLTHMGTTEGHDTISLTFIKIIKAKTHEKATWLKTSQEVFRWLASQQEDLRGWLCI